MKASVAPKLPVQAEHQQQQQHRHHWYHTAGCSMFTPLSPRFTSSVLVGIRWDDVEFLTFLLLLLLLLAVLHL